MPPRIHLRALIAASCITSAIAANPLSSQDLWGRGLEPGQLSVSVGGLFESTSDRLAESGGRTPLSARWTADDLSTLFPGSDELRDALRGASGLQGWTGTAGELRSAVQVSRVTFPVELRLGVLDRLTIGGRITSRKERLEAVTRVSPGGDPDLGVNPVVGGFAGVEAFLEQLDAAVASLPSPGTWSAFAADMRRAYGAGGFFPVGGTTIADALVGRLQELDEALVASGNAPAGLVPVFAELPIDGEEFARLLTAGDGLYRYAELNAPRLDWNPGDWEVWANWDVLREGGLSTIDGRGVSVWAGARLPTGAPENPNLHFDVGSGDGQLDLLGGADGWIRRAKWGVSGGFDVSLPIGSASRGVRLVDGSSTFSPAIWFATADWTPGTLVRFRLFPSLSPATGLWFDAGWTMETRSDGTWEFGEPGPGLPDPQILRDGSGASRHDLTFGLRYRIPDLMDGRVEVWSRWSRTIEGSGSEAPGFTPAWTTLDVGGRIWRSIW